MNQFVLMCTHKSPNCVKYIIGIMPFDFTNCIKCRNFSKALYMRQTTTLIDIVLLTGT